MNGDAISSRCSAARRRGRCTRARNRKFLASASLFSLKRNTWDRFVNRFATSVILMAETYSSRLARQKGRSSRLPDLAEELVRSKVDIIVASLTPAVTAARKATSEIPIVMAPAGDPVATGLISSLARPGGNITGVSATAAELSSKNLELVRDILPSARNIAVLHNPNDPFARVRLEQLQQGAKGLQFDIRTVTTRSNDEMSGTFASMARERPDAVILPGNLPTHPMIELSLQHRLQPSQLKSH